MWATIKICESSLRSEGTAEIFLKDSSKSQAIVGRGLVGMYHNCIAISCLALAASDLTC